LAVSSQGVLAARGGNRRWRRVRLVGGWVETGMVRRGWRRPSLVL